MATMLQTRRTVLPRCHNRLRLGKLGLQVSPICIGITESPATVPAAFEMGVNFFFLTGDLHWPLYEATRRGLSDLLAGSKARRDDLVVGVVSYLSEPLFRALQVNEVIDAVPGLERVDLLLAGAVSGDDNFYSRIRSLHNALFLRHGGAVAAGATFHNRPYAAVAANYGLLDIAYTRFNTLHLGACNDLFPYLPPDRATLNYNFKSAFSRVSEQRFKELGFTEAHWFPEVTDYYRFVLSKPEIDGLLCSPASPSEAMSLAEALGRGALLPEQEEYMVWLSSMAYPRIFV